MNWRNYLHSAVMLFTAALSATAPSSASADLVTFEVHGHMIDAAPPDFEVGDKFTATYTFDPNVQPYIATPDNAYAQYTPITTWRFDFDKGYRFIPPASSALYIADIGVRNNLLTDQPTAFDGYEATFFNPVSIGLSIPSGGNFSFLQIGLQDQTPVGNPDLLSDVFLHTSPPDIDLADYPVGRLVYEDNGPQPYFTVDSITVVPEPSTAILAIIGFGVLAIIWLLRHCLRWGQRSQHRRSTGSGDVRGSNRPARTVEPLPSAVADQQQLDTGQPIIAITLTALAPSRSAYICVVSAREWPKITCAASSP